MFGNRLAPVTRILSRGAVIVGKRSPEILLTSGIVTGVVAAVMGAKATLKLEEEVDTLQEDRENVEKLVEAGGYDDKPKELARDKAYIYTKSFMQVAKIYAPAVGLGVLSISCILAAHGIMRKRNAALVAAYTTLDKAFREYRQRVVEVFGEDAELALERGAKVDREKESDDETPDTHSVTSPINPYVRYFDEYNMNWTKNAAVNKTYLISAQNYFNDRLRATGHVFLNEVLDHLGFKHSQVGALVGWVWKGEGDSYIDFRIDDPASEASRAFMNEEERSIRLDFNVDGVIYDLIEE